MNLVIKPKKIKPNKIRVKWKKNVWLNLQSELGILLILCFMHSTRRERKSLGNLQHIRACCGCLQGGDTRWRYSQIQRYVRTLLSGHRELTYFRSGWVIVKEFLMICFLKWNASTDALDDRWIWLNLIHKWTLFFYIFKCLCLS